MILAVTSVGYILYAGFLYKRFDGIGVKSLSIFTGLWGANFVLSGIVIYVFTQFGITDGRQLSQLRASVPPTLQPVLASEALFSGLLSVGAIFAWLWFVLRYTQRIGRREKTAVAIIGGGTFLVAALNGFVGAATTFGALDLQPSLRVGIIEFATVIEILGTSVAIGVGTALLYVTATQHQPLQQRAVGGLVFPILAPWLVGHLYQFGLVTNFGTISALRTVTLGLGLGGLWLVVTRYDIFAQLPASRAVGRQTAFDSSDTAIIVVNNAGNVSDLNPAAKRLFSLTNDDPIGSPLESILPDTIDPNALTQTEGKSFKLPNSDTVLETTTTTATDDSGQPIGQTIVFTDITDERRRQQRIQVLNRILRHNLRNDLNAAKGYVDVMAQDSTDTDRYQTKIESILDDLVTIGNKAQNTETVLAADPLSTEPQVLTTLVDEAINAVKADYDSIPVTVSVPAESAVRINPVVLRSIIEELVENAVRHSNCSQILVEYDQETRSLIVTDDGSGIPEHEIAVLDKKQETDLQHGSGLGLWMIKWGTDSFGGSATFETGATGTRVEISIPAELVTSSAS